jgi:hypothetical protein
MPAPRGLRTAGRRLWRAVEAEFELGRAEEDRLRRACELADLREELRVSSDVNVKAIAEVRRLSLDIDKLLLAIGIDQQDQASRSAVAASMARRRWQLQAQKEANIGRQTPFTA